MACILTYEVLGTSYVLPLLNRQRRVPWYSALVNVKQLLLMFIEARHVK